MAKNSATAAEKVMAEADDVEASTPRPDPPETRPVKYPTRVAFVRDRPYLDWCGGKSALGVGPQDAWEIEPGTYGVMFFPRGPLTKKAYLVPYAAISFIEFETA